MKKFLFILVTTFFLMGCSKDDEVDNTEYYVKYEVSCRFKRYYGSYRGSSIKISGTGVRSSYITDKYNNYTWSEIGGPFQKGDKLHLSVKTVAPRGAAYITDASISVCKTACPFVIKRSSNTNGSASLTYNIE